MVILSMEECERQQALIDLYRKLAVAEQEISYGAEDEDFLSLAKELRNVSMQAYKFKIYPTAKQDLLEIIDYLNTLSADAALRYYDLLTEKISGLSQMPGRCPHPKDLALTAKGYRYLMVKNYLVFYVAAGDIVQIRRILYGLRDYLSLL